MCGINAIFGYAGAAPEVSRDELRTVRDAMSRRGPDGSGEWFSDDGRVALGHRRLAIIDLSPSGAQPMALPDAGLVITFNGEIYNYRALRSELEREGCHFRSTSDTEVVLRLYERRGVEAISAMRGMFAFALWDSRRRGMLLARDPFGIKPLYYASDGRTLRVASQVKALRSSGSVSSDPDPAGITGFLLWGSVPEPYTLYRSVQALPAGHTLWIDERGLATPRQHVPIAGLFRAAAAAGGRTAGKKIDSFAIHEAARHAFLDSVTHHLVADVEVGAFLSAGIDSSAIVSLATEATSAPLRTVTLSFEEFKGSASDESPLAEETAKRLGTRHETRTISRADFLAEVPALMDAMDQPTIDGVNTYFVSRATAQTGLKVALSGLGGDELLGGYPTFRDIPWLVRAASIPSLIPGLGRMARPVLSPLLGRRGRYASLLEHGGTYGGVYSLRRGLFAPWELPDVVGREIAVEGLSRLDPVHMAQLTLDPDPGTPFSRISVLEACLFMRNQLLRDSDWASMAHALEVRVPLVDVPLWRALAALPDITGASRKSWLAKAPRPPLPDSLLHRPKTGFSIPVYDWISSSPALDGWKREKVLNGPTATGARRWAYTVLESFVGSPLSVAV